MLKQSSDRESVGRYVEAVRRLLNDDRLRHSAAAAAVRLPGKGDFADIVGSALPPVESAPSRPDRVGPDPSPYLSRDPLVSLLQSVLDSALREHGVTDTAGDNKTIWSTVVHTAESLLHPGNFSPDDPDWVIKIAKSMLGHFLKGTHPFNQQPAAYEISDRARLVVVGDWGTGLPRARSVAAYMADAVAEGLDDRRDVHVIHLGDVYYSGLDVEYQRRVLSYWPVIPAQAEAGVTSWSLNGNHDMYSGGFGYFDTLLADARFQHQKSPDGRATSYFHLFSRSWNFVGLDTAWDSRRLWKGNVGVLNDPQAEFVAAIARPRDKKLALFSHHQYLSVYSPDDLGEELGNKLAPVLDNGLVTAWWWGHEHRCMGFLPTGGVRYPRCLGHGGVPVFETHDNDPVPPPGAWKECDYLESDGEQWARFGFAILDLNDEIINVQYVNDLGAPVRAEVIR